MNIALINFVNVKNRLENRLNTLESYLNKAERECSAVALGGEAAIASCSRNINGTVIDKIDNEIRLINLLWIK